MKTFLIFFTTFVMFLTFTIGLNPICDETPITIPRKCLDQIEVWSYNFLEDKCTSWLTCPIPNYGDNMFYTRAECSLNCKDTDLRITRRSSCGSCVPKYAIWSYSTLEERCISWHSCKKPQYRRNNFRSKDDCDLICKKKPN
ncbi:uncharacterized protein LOC111518603 [Drosophila willistoni]|uniref:uncharacterized protein LOC111518603 n=1 Tax=Drosophila willistoni TaxID=7260 RepID=UPI001F076A8D|nr:uncharacterized protein LOC111518603 [Drosophila willistoni]